MNLKKEIATRYPAKHFGDFSDDETKAIEPFIAAQPQLAEATREIGIQQAAIADCQSAIETARADYDRLTDAGLISQAHKAAEEIPVLQRKIDAAKARIAEIGQKMKTLDATIYLDGDGLTRRIAEARQEVEKMQKRLMVTCELATEIKTGITHILTATEGCEVKTGTYVTTSTGD